MAHCPWSWGQRPTSSGAQKFKTMSAAIWDRKYAALTGGCVYMRICQRPSMYLYRMGGENLSMRRRWRRCSVGGACLWRYRVGSRANYLKTLFVATERLTSHPASSPAPHWQLSLPKIRVLTPYPSDPDLRKMLCASRKSAALLEGGGRVTDAQIAIVLSKKIRVELVHEGGL